jgi:hypothetical protein
MANASRNSNFCQLLAIYHVFKVRTKLPKSTISKVNKQRAILEIRLLIVCIENA